MGGKMLGQIEIVVFDFDGVLAGSKDGDPFNTLCQIHISDRSIKKLLTEIGKMEPKSTDWIGEFEKAGADIADREFLYRISDCIFELTKKNLIISPEVQKVIPELAKRVSLAILTNNCKKAVKYCLSDFLRFFSCIKTFEDLEKLKPHPEGLLAISEDLKIDPSKILLVGDSKDDIEAAKAAKTQIVIVSREKEKGLSNGITFIPNIESLLEMIPKKRE